MDTDKDKGLNQGAEGKKIKILRHPHSTDKSSETAIIKSMEAIKAVRHQDQEHTPECLKQMPQET